MLQGGLGGMQGSHGFHPSGQQQGNQVMYKQDFDAVMGGGQQHAGDMGMFNGQGQHGGLQQLDSTGPFAQHGVQLQHAMGSSTQQQQQQQQQPQQQQGFASG
jgi:hypothetical protein